MQCRITGSKETELFCEQGAYHWIRYPASGFVCLAEMPDLADATKIQSDNVGTEYILGYERKWKSKLRRSLGRARHLRRLMHGKSVLDVGSNVGLFVHAANKVGLDCTGIEISRTLYDYACNRFPNYRFIRSPLEEMEIGDTFDGIYCSEVIEHVPNVRQFAERLYAILDTGGVLYLTTPNLNEYTKDGNAVRNLGAPDHKLYFNKSNITAFLHDIGFSKVRHRLSFGSGIKVIAVK